MTPVMSQGGLRRDAGFTLLELLIGLALMALLTTLLIGALGGIRQAQRSHDRRTIEASTEPVEAYLRQVMADMRPVRSSTATTAPLIEGREDFLAFISGYGPPGGFAGLHRITLQLTQSTRSGLYDLEEVRMLHRPGRAGNGEVRTRLLTGISGWRLSYLGAARQGQVATWGPAWASPAQLPQMVTLDIVFPADDPRRWTQLSVAIPAGR